MKLKLVFLGPLIWAGVGVAIGSLTTNWIRDSQAHQARYKNYTDRGRICLEAAALLRAGESITARKYLETRALGAIRGVPMGRSYEEMSPDSQELIVAAKLYDTRFTDVDFDIDRLTRNDVPDSHPSLSTTMRAVTGNIKF